MFSIQIRNTQTNIFTYTAYLNKRTTCHMLLKNSACSPLHHQFTWVQRVIVQTYTGEQLKPVKGRCHSYLRRPARCESLETARTLLYTYSLCLGVDYLCERELWFDPKKQMRHLDVFTQAEPKSFPSMYFTLQLLEHYSAFMGVA